MSTGEVRPEEKDVLARARAGDQDAFTELVRAHQHEVFTLALRLVADRELAGDVTQEALIRAWRALPKFRGDAKFSTWLHRITVNVAWSQRAKARRHAADPLDVAPNDPIASGISPELSGEGADLRPRLLAALDSLTPELRSVVVLKDVYGWSHREISDHLSITVTSAKVRLHRARKRLQDELWHEVEEAS
jgi:RNA polymerase sigma-70 factor (ECF subfamily)